MTGRTSEICTRNVCASQPFFLPNSQALQQVFQSVKSLVEGETGLKVGMVIMYGELFGGVYPHADVPQQCCPYVPLAISNCLLLRPVQKGVYYSSGIHFAAFDIIASFFGTPCVNYVLGWDQMVKVLSTTNIKHVPVFMEGNRTL